MTKEYPIWGVPPNQTDETLLYTKATSMNEALRVKRILEQKHNCTNVRIQILDLSNCNVVDMFRKTVK